MTNMNDEKPEWWPSNERIGYLFDKLEARTLTEEENDELMRITEYRRECAILDGDNRKYALTGLVLNHLQKIREVIRE